MENQHRHIRGYRELSQDEIDDMRNVKAIGASVGELCLRLREKFRKMPTNSIAEMAEMAEALRWLDAGELQLQQGIMAITRSIARPTSF